MKTIILIILLMTSCNNTSFKFKDNVKITGGFWSKTCPNGVILNTSGFNIYVVDLYTQNDTSGCPSSVQISADYMEVVERNQK